METQLFRVLDFIAHKEFQLENIRQLLCEEVTFNLYDAFSFLKGQKDQETINIYHLKSLIGKKHNTMALESLVKFYSNNNLNLNLEQFTKIIITREDQLLSKLTCEREQTSMELPEYIVSYIQKIFIFQEQIHAQLNNLRKHEHKTEMQHLLKYKKDLGIDQELLKSQFVINRTVISQKAQDLCCFISVQLALRYIKKGISTKQLIFNQLSQLFIPQNCILIQNYLKIQENNFNNQVIKNKLRESSPLIHKQFKKLKKYNQKQHQETIYSYRQRISVENHINRNKKLPTSQIVKAKIQSFSKYAQQKMKIFFRYLKKMIKLQVEINRIKKQNLHQQSHLLNELYHEITSNDFMIPSQLRMYIQKAGSSVQLNAIFVFFKKYANSVTGRLSKKQFIKVFRPNHHKQSSQTKRTSLTLQDRRHFINIILSEILLECKIEKYKLILQQKEIDMRQSFNVMDVDGKGKISITDLEVTYVKIMGEKLDQQDLLVLWRRMGKKNPQEYVQYDVFMFQMLPKTRHNITKFKNNSK